MRHEEVQSLQGGTKTRSHVGVVRGSFHARQQPPLGELIRGIDHFEVGPFTLIQPTQRAVHYVVQEDAPACPKAEMTCVALPIATPLRRPLANYKREQGQKPGEHKLEMYARAALELLDR